MNLDLLVALQVGSTLLMTGLIWFVQLVHYPMFAGLDRERFAALHAEHSRRTGRVVTVPMLLELVTGVWLWWRSPGDASHALWGMGLVGLAVVWTSTALMQIPEHARLARGWDAAAHRRLVRGNWVRTLTWTARAWVVLAAAGLLSLLP
jgi:hypothetical protein